ncbi:c-type cytochrome [Hydrogenophaga luteola]|uniref:C-type cytochrome n=1 Tax=Hydrogenophaga luteola TaxID=1591122 RepID=A0ABV7W0I0_9BURK
MKTPVEHRRGAVWVAVAASIVLAACGGGSGDDGAATTKSSPPRSTISPLSSTTAPAATVAASTEGRLLASNCFQCHGTNGTGGFDSIRGGEAEEITEFLTKTASKDIMAAHAQGYTPAQLQKIIAYLQQ